MEFVHELLYLSDDISRIVVKDYTEMLSQYLFQAYKTKSKVSCRIDMEDFILPIETAIPLGLVMSEFITNSLKYAFPDISCCREEPGKPCTITISLKREGNDYLLIIADNGIVLREMENVTTSNPTSLDLIRFIIEHQLQGNLEISTSEGTLYNIRFPESTLMRHDSNGQT